MTSNHHGYNPCASKHWSPKHYRMFILCTNRSLYVSILLHRMGIWIIYYKYKKEKQSQTYDTFKRVDKLQCFIALFQPVTCEFAGLYTFLSLFSQSYADLL